MEGEGRRTRLAGAGLGAGLVLVLLGALTALAAPALGSTASTYAATSLQARTQRWSGALDVSSRTAVNAAYWARYAPGLKVSTGWSGNNLSCGAGQNSAAALAATGRAINFVRSLGGLAPVRLSSTLDHRSLLTALIMSANNSLSHEPPRSWRCYTSTGAANARRSNLALSWPAISPAGAIGLYMTDDGSTNLAVGHRRWLMYPWTTTMGAGLTATAQAMTVIGPTSKARPSPTWVSWPTNGWFPNTLQPAGRWSLSAGSTAYRFQHATVQVYRGGHRLAAHKLPVEDGYGMPTLAWQMPSSVAATGSYKVVVSGIQRAGTSKRFHHTYWVNLFTPSQG